MIKNLWRTFRDTNKTPSQHDNEKIMFIYTIKLDSLCRAGVTLSPL